MADKAINELIAATAMTKTDLLVLEQNGVAKKLSGSILGDYVYAAAAEKVAEVNAAVAAAQTAVNTLNNQKNSIAQSVASMASLGTDTTLSTSGMAADAKATGDKIKQTLKEVPDSRYTSANDVLETCVIGVSSTAGVPNMSNTPFGGYPGFLISYRWTDSLMCQVAFPWGWTGLDGPKMFYRVKTFQGWQSWYSYTPDIYNFPLRTYLQNNSSGILLHRNNVEGSAYEAGGLSMTYLKDSGVYRIVGTGDATSQGYQFLNVVDTNFEMRQWLQMKQGARYRIALKRINNSSSSVAVSNFAIYYNTNSSSPSWQRLSTYKSGVAHLITIPANAIGLLVRFEIEAQKYINADFAFEMVEYPGYTPYMLSLVSQTVNAISATTFGSCDNVTSNCVVFNSVSGSSMYLSDFPMQEPGWLFTYLFDGNDLQFAVGWTSGTIMYRSAKFGTWGSWQSIGGSDPYLMSCDLNTVRGNHFYLLVDSQTYTNVPENRTVGFLQVMTSAAWTTQMFYGLRDNVVYKRTIEGGGAVGAWGLIGGSRDVIQNTYNITTSPVITTDSNGWLAAIDDETTEEANATDMTGAIMSMLNSTGYCHLGPGTFYVSGNIEMPNGSTLEGCGEKTIVRLLTTQNAAYIVRISRRSTIRGIKFSGGKSAPTNLFTDGTNLGHQHGVYCVGNADGRGETWPAVENSIINDCWFEFFDGSGFYAYNTGGGLQQGVMMSSCYFYGCRVGINLDYYFEYAKFTDCITFRCYYACINNGGNNVFTGCTFHGVVGMLMDNSGNDKSNNSHGSIVGCTFNHIDNINHPEILGCGVAIHAINNFNCEIFTGCQLWYGNVVLENCQGFTFSDCLFGAGSVEITVTGSYPAFFYDNMFHAAPTLNVTSGTIFVNNYTKAGVLVAP